MDVMVCPTPSFMLLIVKLVERPDGRLGSCK